MATRTTAVSAFEHVSDAQAAVRELRQAGFAEQDISVLAHDRDRTTTTDRTATTGDTKAGQGAVTGAAVGAGGGALWSLGVAAGMLPAIGPVIAGGIFAAALASAAGGAAVGGIAGALIGTGVPEEEAKHYETEFSRGRTIVSVNAPARYEEAHAILSRQGGSATR